MAAFQPYIVKQLFITIENGIACFRGRSPVLVEFHFNQWFQRISQSPDVRTLGTPSRSPLISLEASYPLCYEVSVRYIERIQ